MIETDSYLRRKNCVCNFLFYLSSDRLRLFDIEIYFSYIKSEDFLQVKKTARLKVFF